MTFCTSSLEEQPHQEAHTQNGNIQLSTTTSNQTPTDNQQKKYQYKKDQAIANLRLFVENRFTKDIAEIIQHYYRPYDYRESNSDNVKKEMDKYFDQKPSK